MRDLAYDLTVRCQLPDGVAVACHVGAQFTEAVAGAFVQLNVDLTAQGGRVRGNRTPDGGIALQARSGYVAVPGGWQRMGGVVSSAVTNGAVVITLDRVLETLPATDARTFFVQCPIDTPWLNQQPAYCRMRVELIDGESSTTLVDSIGGAPAKRPVAVPAGVGPDAMVVISWFGAADATALAAGEFSVNGWQYVPLSSVLDGQTLTGLARVPS